MSNYLTEVVLLFYEGREGETGYQRINSITGRVEEKLVFPRVCGPFSDTSHYVLQDLGSSGKVGDSTRPVWIDYSRKGRISLYGPTPPLFNFDEDDKVPTFSVMVGGSSC